MAVQGKYEIYWHKQQDSQTPNQPISPQGSLSTSPQDSGLTVRKAAIYGVGLAVAKRGLDTVRNELIASTGNEQLQTRINNAMKGLGYVTAVSVGGVAGAIFVAADVASQTFLNIRELRRSNRATQLENKLRGKRVNIAGGGQYYG